MAVVARAQAKLAHMDPIAVFIITLAIVEGVADLRAIRRRTVNEARPGVGPLFALAGSLSLALSTSFWSSTLSSGGVLPLVIARARGGSIEWHLDFPVGIDGAIPASKGSQNAFLSGFSLWWPPPMYQPKGVPRLFA